jgi:hypothetical protein|uniref:Uncharacterized protein n=1 Tax=viral metagenome TaxID=1070528 RepID=A0A6C0LYF4_9ZZZZ
MPAATTTSLSDVFLGSEQSKYAGIALFITIIIICLSILFTSSKIPIEQRLVFVIFILIISIPSILMSLFELTCIVTGGNYNTRWWCWLLAWVLAIMIIFYCIMIIISLFISMSTYDLANERVSEDTATNNVNSTDANSYAKNIMNMYENDLNNPKEQQLSNEHSAEHLPQQYQPPVPQQTQSTVPQQSQHMDVHQLHSSQPVNGNYNGFDSSDNLSPLDTAFNTFKTHEKQPVNARPAEVNNVEPYTNDNIDKFSLF